MDCRICKEMTDEYFEGKLPSDMRHEVEHHLTYCSDCADYYKVSGLAEMIISHEKNIQPDPFLSSRIMNAIEKSEKAADAPLLIRLLKPALLTASLAASVFTGILIGNVYKPPVNAPEIPVELALINDSEMESVNLLSTE